MIVFVVLATLGWWDWRSVKQSKVFATMFVAFAVFYVASLGLFTFPWRRADGIWDLTMLLSSDN